ncbi:MAG: hypothetical protein RIB52_14550 [Erythrobacter sp.]|uniref:hypothetical protein n=1 Tax=Erythrobacter sp. TaxID=1042 RepID=UPI0032ED4450
MSGPSARPFLIGGLLAALAAAFALLLPRLFLPGGSPDASAPRPGAAAPAAAVRPRLGLHTGLPLYRPLGLGVAELARGEGAVPWQRRALERTYDLVPLDTLAPAEGPTGEGAANDPLEDIGRLAVIQPRGLSPADNVALDDWVTAGGRLLLVLDPALTGEYDLPLGDPGRPNTLALIPPVVERWGLEVAYVPGQEAVPHFAAHPDGTLALMLAGEIRAGPERAASCIVAAERALARCLVGEGSVTLLADAALFEHEDLAREAGQGGSAIGALLDFAFACARPGDDAGTLPRCTGDDAGIDGKSGPDPP